MSTPLACPACNSPHPTARDLERHLRRHDATDAMRLHCACGVSFVLMTELLDHRRECAQLTTRTPT